MDLDPQAKFIAMESRLGVVRVSAPDMIALTAETVEEPIFPAQRMDIGLTRLGIEEWAEIRHN